MPHILSVSPGDDLQAVFDRAPENAVIHLAPGIYRQKAMIRTPGLTLLGAGSEETVIVFDDYARKPHPLGYEYNTFRTWTLAVCADRVTIRDLAVVNDAGSPEVKGQEVALSVVGTDFLMENCRLTSTQDTLFAGPLPEDLIERYDGLFPDELRRGGDMRQTYKNCCIEGSVDFIFGCANALFEDCQIHSVFDGRDTGYVAAPAHSRTQKAGFCFRSCRLTKGVGVAPESVYLARPWRDFGLCSFENCHYGDHICAAGFDKWGDTNRNRTARFYESPAITGRVPWINRAREDDTL